MNPCRYDSDLALDQDGLQVLAEYQETFGQESTTSFVKSGNKFKRKAIITLLTDRI
jgi:hypothetical protein